MKKKQIKHYLKSRILLLGISFLLWNCEKENSELIIENEENIYFEKVSGIVLEKVKKQFYATFNEKTFSSIQNKPQWQKTIKHYNKEGNEYFEIPFQTIFDSDIERGTSVSFDKLIAIFKNNQIELQVIHFFGIDFKKNIVDFENISHTKLSNFSGFITKYDINKNVIDIKRYKNGLDTHQKIKIKSKQNNSILNKAIDEDETSEFSETICTRGCWYWEYSDGSREYFSCSPWGCTTITYQVPGSNTGGSTTSYNTIEEVDKIDDTNLTDPKIKCLNDNLNSSGSSFIKEILDNFEGESDVDIHIESHDKVFNEGKEVNGLTRGIRNGIITIEISESNASTRASLDVVRTLIHEYIHADMYRKLDNDLELHKDPNFKETYEKYNDEKFSATPQHNTMADLYINQMKDALKNYHKNVLTASYNYITNNGVNPLPDLFYEGLAWSGLRSHGAATEAWLNKGQDTLAIKAAVAKDYSELSTTYCPN